MFENIGIDISQVKIEFSILTPPLAAEAGGGGGRRRWAATVSRWRRWAIMLKPYFDFRFEFGAPKIIGLDTVNVYK